MLKEKIKRKYPNQPIAAVGAIIKKEDKVLLVKRRFEPGMGKWSIPGGLIELGERVQDAVVREVKEEVGLSVKIEKLIDVIDNILFDEKGRVVYHYVIADYLVSPVSGELKTSSEILESRWATKEDLKELELTRTCKILLEQIGFI